MDSTAPLLERLFFKAARTAIILIRDLRAPDWVLVGIIFVLVLPMPVYRKGASKCFQLILVLLAGLFTLVNMYILAAPWISNIRSPEKPTIALLDISNFLSPIAADCVLLYNTISDTIVQDISLRSFIATFALPISLKLGRLLDSGPLILNRLRLVTGHERTDEVRMWMTGGLDISPKVSQEIGVCMQMFYNLHAFFLFLKGISDERRAAELAGPLHIPRTSLASQAPLTLILIAFTNFIVPITLSTAQIIALFKSQGVDDMLPFYLATTNALI